jgi:hypothetical protein
MRELVGASLNSGNLEHKEYECAVDRVGALGRATDLGRALYHWVYAGDESAIRSCHQHLVRKARRYAKVPKHHSDHAILERLCLMLLHEWKNKHCRVCHGAAEVSAGGLRVICSKCGGSGLHAYVDGERMSAMKVDERTLSVWKKRIDIVWSCISGADVYANTICREQLGRGISVPASLKGWVA